MKNLKPVAFCSVTSMLTLASVGCGTGTFNSQPIAGPSAQPGIVLRGNVHGGSQPIKNAHIYLFAANSTGYGQPSLSILNAASTGNEDDKGAYALTDDKGDFEIADKYTCPKDTPAYILAVGGNPGTGVNSAASIMAVLGKCPSSGDFADDNPFVALNEVTTVAAAYALAGYATDSTHVSSSGTVLAKTGIANAFHTAANLISVSSGTALTKTPAGNGIVPQKTINAIANLLAGCIDSTGASSAACTGLFQSALANGTTGAVPKDTATAAINLAHNPGANVATLYQQAPAIPLYTPTLTAQPNDWTLAVTYSGGGLAGAVSLAVDADGSVWAASLNNNTLAEISHIGTPISPATGYPGHLSAPIGVAIDTAGNAWAVDAVTSSLAKFSSAGVELSPSPVGYSGGGLNVPTGLAVDPVGNIWIASFHDALSEFAADGTPASPAIGFIAGGLNGPGGVAVDPSGSVWIPNLSGNGIAGISKFSSTGKPLSPVNGFLGGGVGRPFAVAIDHSGNAWVANFLADSLTVLSSSGTPLSPSAGYTGGGLSRPFALALDGAGNAWVANYATNTVSEFDNTGSPISPATGFTHGTLVSPQAVAIDGSGNVWIGNARDVTVTELVGAAIPVVTPIAAAVKNNTLGSRP